MNCKVFNKNKKKPVSVHFHLHVLNHVKVHVSWYCPMHKCTGNMNHLKLILGWHGSKKIAYGLWKGGKWTASMT
jgi:hypothetical protein